MSGITQRMSHEIFISCKLPGTGISHSTPRNVIDLQNIITWGASTFPRLDSFSFFLFFFTRQAEHSCLNGTKLSFARCRLYFLLFWCLFTSQMGHPCPFDMELSPAVSPVGAREFSAECRCPPKTAQSATDGRCYGLFTQGPCDDGHYFAPDTEYTA